MWSWEPPPPYAPPHALVVACLSSRKPPCPFLFRNYDYPAGAPTPRYEGSSRACTWQALRATTAAPLFFPEFVMGATFAEEVATPAEAPSTSTSTSTSSGQGARAASMAFIDGALVANNPSSIALHEARMLFPGRAVGCLVSFGTGRGHTRETGGGSSYQTLRTVVRAATRCDETHYLLEDLLPANGVKYFRFNPLVPPTGIDETSIEKLVELQAAGRAYVSTGGAGDADMSALVDLLGGVAEATLARRESTREHV